MEYIIGIILGALLVYVFVKKPLEITVNHTYKTVIPDEKDLNMDEMEEKMFKPDEKRDKLYDEYDKFLEESREIMGGSDR